MAHAQKPDFVFRRNGRVNLNRQGPQFSRLLAAEVCASAGSNAEYTMFRGSVKGAGYPLHSPLSPSLALPCVTVCHHVSIGVYKNRIHQKRRVIKIYELQTDKSNGFRPAKMFLRQIPNSLDSNRATEWHRDIWTCRSEPHSIPVHCTRSSQRASSQKVVAVNSNGQRNPQHAASAKGGGLQISHNKHRISKCIKYEGAAVGVSPSHVCFTKRLKRKTLRYFRFPPRCRRNLPSSGILRSVEWKFRTDVSGQSALRNVLEEGRSNQNLDLKLFSTYF
jgi:hypothetical protein